jgi:peroxiredoxin
MFSYTINTFFSQKISLAEGDLFPHFELLDQDENVISSTNFNGRRSVIYFFPYADTPG